MDLQLQGKTVLITGSTAGIGFGTAINFLREGASVIINGRSKGSVDKAVQKLLDQVPDGSILGCVADIRKKTEVKSLISQIDSVDILINNVGIYSTENFYDLDDAEWTDMIEVNLMSGVRLSRHYLPLMKQKGWGRIIFISSECATMVPESLIAYSTTKAAIQALSRGLAQLCKGTNVTVNTISPGSTYTEGAETFMSTMAEDNGVTIEQATKDFFSAERSSSLLQRFATVEEVAKTIVYFSSPLASATNGSVIKVDGGSTGGII